MRAGRDLGALRRRRFVRICGPLERLDDAWMTARAIVDAAVEPSLAVIGDFVVPPAEGPPSRDFQTLHLDFGVPLAPARPMDVARFTALYISADTPRSVAVTRLVPLRSLLSARTWPCPDDLVRRFAEYGNSHGARDDAAGYVEGSLARIAEAALGGTPVLPSVKTHLGFRCGMEFASLAEELTFFARRDLRVDAVTTEVRLEPGELLVFDNLALAHGRRGVRRPGELHQRVFGHRALPVMQQLALRERLLAAFAP